MKTKTFFPFNEGGSKLVSKGDVIELVSGEKIVFLETRRTKWLGKFNGKNVVVSFYGKFHGLPTAKAIVGRDETVLEPTLNPKFLKKGDIFALEGCKETFMFIGHKTKKSKIPTIQAKDLASKKIFNIGAEMQIIPINLEEFKKSLDE